MQRYEHARVPVPCKLTNSASSNKKHEHSVGLLRVQALLLLLYNTCRVCEYPVRRSCETTRFVAECEMRASRGESGFQVFCWRERVSGILLKRKSLPGANEVGWHDRGNHYSLSMYYTSELCGTWHYTLMLL